MHKVKILQHSPNGDNLILKMEIILLHLNTRLTVCSHLVLNWISNNKTLKNMNNNKIFKALLVFISVGLLSSCEKYLDEKPIDTVPEVNVFESMVGLQNAIIGAYAGVSPAVEEEIYQTALVCCQPRITRVVG
jgi:uncharacterized protein with HEPN domain